MYFECYDEGLAEYLKQNGFKYIGTQINPRDTRKNIQLFEFNKLINFATKHYTENIRKKEK